jgi:hypothetical protein
MTSFLRRLAAEHVGQTPVLHPLRASMYGERPGGGPDRVAEEPDPMEVAQDVEIDGSAPVSQVIGRPVDVPAALAELLARPTYAEPMAANYSVLRSYLSEN